MSNATSRAIAVGCLVVVMGITFEVAGMAGDKVLISGIGLIDREQCIAL